MIYIVEMHVYPLSAKSKCIQMGKSRDENTYVTAHNRHILCSAKVQGLTGSLIVHLSKSMADDAELGAFPGLTPTDRENLAGGDENFKPHNWEDLKRIIGRLH